ncbi:MAG: hybrid sensor histidine kinase/response regulator [Verrucomicrobiota bacterium JB022]|nr:hybrid sensor histidine kinase/response regulator [Verrucomicrobiota bacterium JB022]
MQTPTGQHNGEPLDILAVDDTPANLRVLSQALKRWGYRVRPAPNGEIALQAALARCPDLILLDVNMPDMDGYEVCRRLKAIPDLAHVPVIFISALSETLDKVTAFRVGGVDYITKPFELEEVEARVRTHLQLRETRRQLEAVNHELERLVSVRTEQLELANDRLKMLDHAKDEFLHLIAHELRTPLNGILGVAGILFDSFPDDPQVQDLQPVFENAERRLLDILNDALMLSEVEVRPESLAKSPLRIDELMRTLPFSEWQLEGFDQLTPTHLLLADVASLRRALESLMRACRNMAPHRECRAVIQLNDHFELRLVSIETYLDEEVRLRMFEPFAISEIQTAGVHLGLGPALASRILALFDGTISAEQEDDGVTFIIRLPWPGASFTRRS